MGVTLAALSPPVSTSEVYIGQHCLCCVSSLSEALHSSASLVLFRKSQKMEPFTQSSTTWKTYGVFDLPNLNLHRIQ